MEVSARKIECTKVSSVPVHIFGMADPVSLRWEQRPVVYPKEERRPFGWRSVPYVGELAEASSLAEICPKSTEPIIPPVDGGPFRITQ